MLDSFCFVFDFYLYLGYKVTWIHSQSTLADCTRAWFLSGGVRFHVSSSSFFF